MLNQQPFSSSQAEGSARQGMGSINEDLTLDMSLAFPEVIQHAPKKNQSWRWLLVSLLSCCAAGGVAIGAFVWLINLPPTANCENAATVTTDRAQLYCAQVAADTGELNDVVDSLILVGAWDQSHPLHHEVQPLVEKWSWIVLQAAQDKLLDSDMDGAVDLIGHIPPSSPVYETAQASLASWNSEWEEGEAIWAVAQTALKQQDWPTASQQVSVLSELENHHWRVTQVQNLSQQILQERRAQRQLAEAVELASPGGSDRLGAAIEKASKIDTSTYAHQTAQNYMDQWSDLLLKLGQDKWYAADLDEAIAIGRSVALNESRAKIAQELIWMSQARKLARQSLGDWHTSPHQLVHLYKAMMLANRVPTDSPYYPQAKSSIATWKTHMQDLTQLQVAQMAGRIQTLDTLKLAVTNAQKVPLGHPRRVQAQTLIAHWQQEIERLEDRPLLVKAQHLAADKTIEAYQAAIQMASNIPLNRALRAEAQDWVYIWQSEIETIQDQPILDRARALAADSKLSQAIAEASNIRSGRALYDDAQASISQWQQEIRAIERARQRKLQEAARQRQEPSEPAAETTTDTPETTDPVVDPANRSEPAVSAPRQRSAAPAPVPAGPGTVEPSPSALPDRIETVPAEAAPARPAAPIETGPPRQPVIPSLPNRPPAPPPLEAPSPAEVTTPPPTAPVPISAPAEPEIPVPAAPAPQPIINTAPPASPAPPASTGASTPKPPPALEPQATRSAVPTVSARPQPESAAHLKTSGKTDVLYTGALYAGL